MSKISLDEVAAALQKKQVDAQVAKSVIDELTEIIKEEQESRSSTPKRKNEFLFVLNDPNDEYKGKDLTGWVVTIKEGGDASTVLSKIKDAAIDSNEAKKRKRGIITNMVEAFRGVKTKFLKQRDVAIKTKEPVQVLITNGKF
jgi:hypothetical protein